MRQLAVLLVVILALGPALTGAQVDNLSMELVYSDNTEDDTYDLHQFWMGNTSEHLYFMISYATVSNNSSVVDLEVTLRVESGTTYLITAAYSNDSYSLVIQEAESLAEPTVAADNSVNIQYIEQQIFFNPLRDELGFFLDWSDLGGISQVDVIVWEQTDRLPDDGYVSFDGTQTVNRVVDFNEAILGNYEPADDTETSTEPMQWTTTATSPGDKIGNLVLLLVVIGLVLGIGRFVLLKRRDQPTKSTSKETGYGKPVKQSTGPRAQTPPPVKQDDVEMKYIEELNKEVRMCCYQTARLNETYCFCGRAVTDELRQLFESE